MTDRVNDFAVALRSVLRAGTFARTFAGALLAISAPAFAQDGQQPPPSSNEIDNPEQSAISAAATITHFSAASLEAKGIQSPLQAAQFVPNMFAATNVGTASAGSYFLRGLGNTESIATVDPAVGTAIDGIYLARQNANSFNFFDIERLEILRGPQGTQGGRNTLGGTVSVVLKRPEPVLGGYVEAAYGAYGRTSLRGSLNLPLSSGVGFKISGYYQDDDGYVSNTTTGERLNDVDAAGLRGAVRLDLTDSLEWNGSVAYIRSSGENIANFACDPANPANCGGRFATTGLRTNSQGLAAIGVTGRKADFGLGNNAETVLYTSNFEWRSDAATLNLITGYVDLRQQFHLDLADGRDLQSLAAPMPAVRGLAFGGYGILNDGKHSQFSQEVKLSGTLFGGMIDYATGVYLLDETNRTDFADTFASAVLLADRTLNNTTKSIAGYFEGDFNVSDALKLTAGIRYTDETRTFRVADNRQACNASTSPECLDQGNLIAANGTPIPARQKAKVWTPRFALSYQASDYLLLFASATRGFKSGGWNARAVLADQLLPFGPETIWSYEAGFKSAWFDQRLHLNVTGFYLQGNDLQAPSAFVNSASRALSFITQNAADFRNHGLEMELTVAPVEQLNLFVNVGYQKAEYVIDASASDFNAAGIKSAARQQRDCLSQLAAGKIPLAPGAASAADCAVGIITADGKIASPVRTPSLTMAFGGTYDFRLPSAGVIITPSLNALWRSSYEQGLANATIYTGSITAGDGTIFPANPFGGDVLTGSSSASYIALNAGIMMKTDDDHWTVAIECQNCLDTAWHESSLGNSSYLNSPRYWQVRMKRVF